MYAHLAVSLDQRVNVALGSIWLARLNPPGSAAVALLSTKLARAIVLKDRHDRTNVFRLNANMPPKNCLKPGTPVGFAGRWPVSNPAATLRDPSHRCCRHRRGRPRLHPVREILNAIFYVVRSGRAWRLLPHDFLAWQTAYHYFRLWRLDGTWEHVNAVLREQLRVSIGRNAHPPFRVVW
jgi:transposase